MAINYTINWSNDTLKAPFTLAAGTLDTSTTSLALTGRGYVNWGEKLEENLVRLLEHFAGPTAPPNPTIGQQWFNSTSKVTSVYYNGAWNVIADTSALASQISTLQGQVSALQSQLNAHIATTIAGGAHGGTSGTTPTPTPSPTPSPTPAPTPAPTPSPTGAPVITIQPSSTSVVASGTATFSVTATGASSYQWQRREPGSSTWVNVDSAYLRTYTTGSTSTADNGATYRVIVTNSVDSIASVTVTLTVTSSSPAPAPAGSPVITVQPVNRTVIRPATATFSVTATGASSYQWQKEESGTTVWNNIDGAWTASYTTGATSAADTGDKYRVIISNTNGSVASNVVTLTANATSPSPVPTPTPTPTPTPVPSPGK